MKTTPILTDEQVSDVAFDLLTSSGIRRYARMASQAAIEIGLVGSIFGYDGRNFEARMVLRAHDLLGAIARGQQRSEHEPELATILAALILANAESAATLCGKLALLEAANLRWVTAMARELMAQRRVAQENAEIAIVDDFCMEQYRILSIAAPTGDSLVAGNDTYQSAA